METMRHSSLLTGFLLLVLLTGEVIAESKAEDSSEPREMDWTELMPPEELAKLESMPPVDHGDVLPFEDGPVDPLAQDAANAVAQAMDPEWQAILSSTNVRPELDGARVRIPGFIVPLEFNDKQETTEFFLVPYMGACIHVPPPPPNQIIHVVPGTPVKMDRMWEPYWIVGTLATSLVENDIATSAYSLVADEVILYEE
ncbi:MAG: DUF3299 domain-containing protein [Chromatiales bacterium]|jgi:hypothetical protein